jgi:hypothetical protein
VATFLSTLALTDLSEVHIAGLVADGVAESRELDFKRMPYDNRDAKREFLKDVTALANTFGGHLVIGVAEVDGIASEVVAITDRSFDGEKQRLENLLRDAVEPRLIGVQMQQVPIAAGGFALVIHVPRSWNPPHRVLMGDNRFFGRNSTGAYPMDVEQLRAVFLGASELEQRVRKFREERIKSIASGQTPVRIRSAPITLQNVEGRAASRAVEGPAKRALVVLHIVPLAPGTQPFDLLRAQTLNAEFAPFLSQGRQPQRPNLDGMLTMAGHDDDQTVSAYGQLFRDGRIETVRAIGTTQGQISPRQVREGLVNGLPRYLRGLTAIGFGPPFAVMLTLVGVQGLSLALHYDDPSHPADRDNLLVDPVTIDTAQLAGAWHHHLRPVLDAFWNAFGVSRCPDFTEDGQWALS